MFNKLISVQIICMLACILLAGGLYVFFKPNTILSKLPTVQKNESKEFTNNLSNIMVADTFIYLIKTAYPGFATCVKQGNALHVSIQGAGALTQDFYNGNDNLLKYRLADFGFEIKYLQQTKSIEADFKLENDGVTVPNDVLLRLVSKTFKKPLMRIP